MKQDMIDGRVEFLPSSQEERKCWVAICLEIDLTSQGERFLEAAENIQDALKKWVCACIEHETLWFYKVSHRKNQKQVSPVQNKARKSCSIPRLRPMSLKDPETILLRSGFVFTRQSASRKTDVLDLLLS